MIYDESINGFLEIILTRIRDQRKEVFRHVGNDVTQEFSAGEEHFLKVRLFHSFGFRGQEVQVNFVKNRWLVDFIVIGKIVSSLQCLGIEPGLFQDFGGCGQLFGCSDGVLDIQLTSDSLIFLFDKKKTLKNKTHNYKELCKFVIFPIRTLV